MPNSLSLAIVRVSSWCTMSAATMAAAAAPTIDPRVFVQKVTALAAERLDDDQIGVLVQHLVAVLVQRADEAPSGAECAKRHNRIQSLIKRL